MATKGWYLLVTVTSALSRGAAHLHLYKLCFWLGGWGMYFLDRWDGGYPELDSDDWSGPR